MNNDLVSRTRLLQQLKSARWLWVSLLVFGVTRLGLGLIAYIAVPIVIDPSVPPRPYFRLDNIILDVFGGRWDSAFYIDVAEKGYTYYDVPLPTVAFFPLLPLLIRAILPLVGNALVAGIMIANMTLLGATMLLYRLADDEWGSGTADRAVWYMLIFPTSFFGSAVYGESLFLLGAIGALYSARKGSWKSAGAFGVIATLARPVGIIVSPMLLIEWWMQRSRRPVSLRPPRMALTTPAAVLLGIGSYMAYLQYAFGDPLAFVHAQAKWGRQRSPLDMFGEVVQRPPDGWLAGILAGHVPLDAWIDLVFVLFFLALALVLFYQRRWSEGTLIALGIMVELNAGQWMAQRRHVWVLFPAFILLARWGVRGWIDRIITMFFLLGLALFLVLFVNWYWVA